MTFQLPAEATTAFPAMLAQLDKQLDALDVQEYGISQVTMEEALSGQERGDRWAIEWLSSIVERVEDRRGCADCASLGDTPLGCSSALRGATVKRAQYERGHRQHILRADRASIDALDMPGFHLVGVVPAESERAGNHYAAAAGRVLVQCSATLLCLR